MKLNKDAVLKIALNLPFGEKRTEKEIINALKDNENPEHDYLTDLYLTELKGGLYG